MKKEVYDIGGMHCAACSAAIERVTGKLDGVVSSQVNLATNRMNIEYDEALCSSEKIIAKIERAGFTAALHEDEKKAKKKADADDREKKSEKASLIASCCFAFLLLTISMGQMLFENFPIPDIFSMHTHPVNFAMLQMLLCIPVLFLGRRFFISGFKSLFHLNPNMDTLVAVSSTASFVFSVIMTLLISDDAHRVHELYFESAAVVVALVSVGKYMEARSKEKTKDAIKKLMKLAPDTAVTVENGVQRTVPTAQVKTGDILLVKAGASVPLDGIVTDGSGSVNEAMLTGESLPAEKSPGSEVIGGSICSDGVLYVKVTRTGSDTTLSKIIKFVEDAQGKKAPISKAADKVAGVFVPIVMAIAVISAVVWLLCGAQIPFALRIFTTVLVIACPCAMGLATPTAIIVGTGLGASKGILIRSGEALEITHKTDVVIFDKTGTLTVGEPKVTDIIAENEEELLTAALSLERLSKHPLAAAVCDIAEEKGARQLDVTAFENINGKGLKGVLQSGETLLAGNSALMENNGVKINTDTEKLLSQGKTMIYVAKNSTLLGALALADTIKPDARAAVDKLKKMGMIPVLLTGDNPKAAEHIGSQAGIDEIVSQVLPTEKAQVVKAWQDKGKSVMMVGDGINDAPALAQADVGCAIGTGSDIAIDSADVVLMKTELTDVCRAVKLSRLTIRNIRQNLFWAFCYNTLGIPVAAGVLYPTFGLLLSPMIGALAMSLSSLFVVTNALRLKGKRI